ncbi:MAG: RNA polymerase Rpb4 [Nitrososphaeria archaeon]
MKMIKSKKITIHEAKDILTQSTSDIDELQRRTFEYVNVFSKLNGEQAKKLVESLEKEVGLEEDYAIQLVNIMPKTPEEIRTYLLGWKKIVPTETLMKINEILNSVKQ